MEKSIYYLEKDQEKLKETNYTKFVNYNVTNKFKTKLIEFTLDTKKLLQSQKEEVFIMLQWRLFLI